MCSSFIDAMFDAAFDAAFPINQLHISVQMFDYGGATIYPVTTIQVSQAVDLFNRGPMDMSANGAVQLAFTRMADDGVLNVNAESHRSLYRAFGIAGQRPLTGYFQCSPQPG